MKILILFILLVLSSTAFAQGPIKTFNDKCISCHPSMIDTFKNANKNLNQSIYKMFVNMSNIKPTKTQLDDMVELASSFKKNKTYINITKLNKNIFEGESLNNIKINLLENNKIIDTRIPQTNFFKFDFNRKKNAKYKLQIEHHNKVKLFDLKLGIQSL